ncbi:MAG: endonuclease/exonuclease/phosphatase family protein [Flavobacteriales bacterium]|nr:endonuclease/exonuclease/phosphatase family protein [Flavobacteriales bacterium]
MRKRIKQSWIGLSIFIALLLFLSQHARTISPADSDIWPIVAMGYPVALLLYLITLLFWLITKRKIAILMAAVLILFGWGAMSDIVQIDPPLSQEERGHSLMSYNARLFGYYQFKRNKEIRDSIFDYLESSDVDILCFQEFYHTTHPKGFQTKPLLIDRLNTPYEHEKYTHEFVHQQYFGVVTLSRFPIVYRGYIPFPGDFNNFCIYSDIRLPKGDTIRVFNTHLASIHFRKEDYEIIDTELSDTDRLTEKSTGILKKLMAANKRRAVQIEHIMEEVERSPHPVIFAGDFNDPPFSHTYYRTKASLQDAFKTKGFGLGNTYNGPFPSFRIDHILHSDEIEVNSYQVDKLDLSDHFPVHIRFEMNDE